MGIRRRCEYERDGQGLSHPRGIWKKLDASCLSEYFLDGLRLRPCLPLFFAENIHSLSKVGQVYFRAWDTLMKNTFFLGTDHV